MFGVVAFLILSLLLSTAEILGAEFIVQVVGVTDGYSIKVMHEGIAEKVRLTRIDCPEKRHPFGTRAKQSTSQLALRKEVPTLECMLNYGY